jgi:NADPH-dependent 2,4-dienoyl-CoA reductase/sulfur reductase-like enzyme/rhodanese-related sulfurtransferase
MNTERERIIIIGGLSAGPSAAAKARRINEEAEILLFEKTAYISYATCGIPYSLSGTIKSRDKLMVVTPELLQKRFNIDVHLDEAVTQIIPEAHQVITAKGTYTYTKLIYAAGAKPFVPPVRNLDKTDQWSNCRTIEDYDKICSDKVLTGKQDIVVLGAGLIGVEVAENLNHIGKNVTLIELSPSILPAWDHKFGNLAENVLKQQGITVHANKTVQELVVEDGKLFEIVLSDDTRIPADYLLMGIGGSPNTELLTSRGAEHIGNGALKVNEKMETSIPDIYAAGDCASIKNVITGKHDYFPMGTHANKGGRAAGANAAGGHETFRGAYKTAIIKVFDYTLARTGMNPHALKMAEIPFESTLIISAGTPGFYPDPTDILLEIYYSKDKRRILGAELFGQKGVDKRVDILSTAILGKLTVDDLPDLDLAYAPPYSPAKDPVIVAGFVSGNKNKRKFSEVDAEDLYRIITNNKQSDIQLLDVRTPLELEHDGYIDSSFNIELDELRARLHELDPAKATYIYCLRGLRGYVAAMILENSGFDEVYNLGGGYKAWREVGFDTVSVMEEKNKP